MPRNIAGPLVRGPDFYGRESEVREAWRLLERGSVLLAAPRRWGKSSLMSALHDDPQPGWRSVLVDVEFVETPSEFLTELTAVVLQQAGMRAAIREVRSLPASFATWIRGVVDEVAIGHSALGEAKLKLRSGLPASTGWRELAEQLLSVLAQLDTDLVIVIDEFPTMFATFVERDPATAIQFLRWFRAQRQQLRPIRFLLGGSVNIEPRLEELGQTALLNDLQRLQVRPFEHAVAVRFVTAVLEREETAFEAGVPDAVVRAVGTGVPFFLHVLLSELISQGGPVAVAGVERAYHERVLGPTHRARFAHYATRLRSYGSDEPLARRILAAVLRGRHTRDALSQDLLEPGASLDRVLVRLQGDYYLTQDDARWAFHSALLRDWWMRNAPAPEAP